MWEPRFEFGDADALNPRPIWAFAKDAREKIKQLLKLMEVVDADGWVVCAAAAGGNVSNALQIVINIVKTVDGFIFKQVPTRAELRGIIRMTREVEQILEPVLHPKLLSGSLAVLWFVSVCCIFELHGDIQNHIHPIRRDVDSQVV